MTATIMSGQPVREAILDDVRQRVAALGQAGVRPGLGTILVGDDPASAHYVARKHETCEELGIHSVDIRIPASGKQSDLLAAVDQLNDDPRVHAFLIQNPVPEGFDFNQALQRVDPSKDADGLHPTNLGLLSLGVRDAPRPCTPMGIQAMLEYYGIEVAGRHVVVVGRGPTLGRPLATLLGLKEPHANAAVTLVHTGVKDWADYTRVADIVVGAAGVPSMITPEVIKPGSVAIGGGLTFEGKKLLSDVDESCADVASFVTARLGGVGATTVAMLLNNTVTAAEQRAGSRR